MICFLFCVVVMSCSIWSAQCLKCIRLHVMGSLPGRFCSLRNSVSMLFIVVLFIFCLFVFMGGSDLGDRRVVG